MNLFTGGKIIYFVKTAFTFLDSDHEAGGRNLLRTVGNSLPKDMRLEFIKYLKC